MEGRKDGRMEGRRECLIDMTISRLSCPKTSAFSAGSAVNTYRTYDPEYYGDFCRLFG